MTARRTLKTREEPRVNARVYWSKARRYAEAAASNSETGLWDPAASNAIHAAISLADAICIHYAGKRSASENHHDALELLQQIQQIPAASRQALSKHLKEILGMKKFAEYEGRLLDEANADAALKHMQRAFGAVSAMARRNGWTD